MKQKIKQHFAWGFHQAVFPFLVVTATLGCSIGKYDSDSTCRQSGIN